MCYIYNLIGVLQQSGVFPKCKQLAYVYFAYATMDFNEIELTAPSKYKFHQMAFKEANSYP